MKRVIHVSSECYPAAKAGGMGDVVGALPLYLPAHDVEASVVIPKYKTKWFEEQVFNLVYEGSFLIAGEKQEYRIEKLKNDILNFPFYCIHLPGLFDRDSIYLAEDGHGFKDEPKRNIAFQTAMVDWLTMNKENYELIHVHDHMAGLIPFFMQYCPKYEALKDIPSVLSIHNGAYRGEFQWEEVASMLPEFDSAIGGILDWDGKINSLATAIKCAWSINTVSPSYMEELIQHSDTLSPLYKTEIDKCIGVLNGIDAKLWDPSTDVYLKDHLKGNWKDFKKANKNILQKKYKLIARRPLVGFIGRFAYQKGADLLLDAIRDVFEMKLKVNIVILGSGDKEIEQNVVDLATEYKREIGVEIAYDESLARLIYAGSDFLIMPSRFEPCGLNQLYAMRYGTVPIASHVGGLKDTVFDIKENGQGIVISNLNKDELVIAIKRAISLYKEKTVFYNLINANAALDYSWHSSAGIYAKLYTSHLKN